MNSQRGFATSFIARLMLSALVIAALIASLPLCASALSVSKCTARPNADDNSNDVLGGTETRITWEAKCDSAESIDALMLTMPAGTSFGTDDVRVTLLSGDDYMTRVSIGTEISSADQTITVRFAQPTSQVVSGPYAVRVEIYEVVFPATGGTMQVTGSYESADGTIVELTGIDPIEVTGISAAEQLSNTLSEQSWVQAWNSNKFLHLFFDPTILVTSFPVVFWGFLMALAIVFVSFPLAIPFGLILALMRMSKLAIVRALASLYVNIVRGTPVFLQIYIAFFGLPLAGIQIPNYPLGVIVLAMNSCAYQCEIMRAGIQSIPKGQFEAARSLGMNAAQTMLFVIIPQTVRRIIPTMTNEFILLYKDTSMLAAVGVMEVVMYAKTIVANTGSITPYIVAACFYLVITLPLSRLVGNLERRLAINDTGAQVKGKKDKGAKSVGAAESASTKLADGIVYDAVSGESRSPEVAKVAGKPADEGITPEEESSL